MAEKQSGSTVAGYRAAGLFAVFLLVVCSPISVVGTPVERADCPALKAGQTCCGGRPYEQDRDRVCCALRRSRSGEKAYVLRNQCVHGITSRQLERCGADLFDNRYEGCCGTVPYDRQHSKCCVGSGQSTVISKDTYCCNGEGLKPGQMCCQTTFLGDVAINKTHSAHTACCEPEDIIDIRAERHRIQTFDNSTHYCFEGQVKPKPEKPLSRPRPDPAKACLKDVQREEGEELECCDDTPFRPSRSTCCEGILYNMPSATSQCCYDRAFALHDHTNPCLRSCSGRPFNSQTQKCCKGRIVTTRTSSDDCCGSSLISLDGTHSCCAGMVIDKKRWSCCQDTMPYDPRLMRCNKETATVILRQKKLKEQSIPSKFCHLRLDTWGERWRNLIDPSLLKVQGRVESCRIRITSGTLTIPMSPAVAVVGGEAVSSCLSEGGLKLVVVLPPKCRLNKRSVKRNLNRQTLEVMVRPDKLRCRGKKGGVIKLGEREVALVLRSQKMDRLLQDASLRGS